MTVIPQPTTYVAPVNVELIGAGELTWALDSQALPAAGVPQEDISPLHPQFIVRFDGTGEAVSCEPLLLSLPVVRAVCQQAMANARFAIDPVLSMPIERRYLFMSLSVETRLRLRPDPPVRFYTNQSDTAIILLTNESQCQLVFGKRHFDSNDELRIRQGFRSSKDQGHVPFEGNKISAVQDGWRHVGCRIASESYVSYRLVCAVPQMALVRQDIAYEQELPPAEKML